MSDRLDPVSRDGREAPTGEKATSASPPEATGFAEARRPPGAGGEDPGGPGRRGEPLSRSFDADRPPGRTRCLLH
jgi:hypothetical protein